MSQTPKSQLVDFVLHVGLRGEVNWESTYQCIGDGALWLDPEKLCNETLPRNKFTNHPLEEEDSRIPLGFVHLTQLVQ
ncbi:hypothetical protein BST61_g4180 [Cercospora zeina]